MALWPAGELRRVSCGLGWAGCLVAGVVALLASGPVGEFDVVIS